MIPYLNVYLPTHNLYGRQEFKGIMKISRGIRVKPTVARQSAERARFSKQRAAKDMC